MRYPLAPMSLSRALVLAVGMSTIALSASCGDAPAAKAEGSAKPAATAKATSTAAATSTATAAAKKDDSGW